MNPERPVVANATCCNQGAIRVRLLTLQMVAS
jgi:hypothetical protein